MNDAGSLQNLNDIVVPGPLSWWPPATGWYVLIGFGLLACALLAAVRLRQWRRNRYRRLAQRELASIREQGSDESLRQLPALLKRAALSVWPREEVAALNGRAWHRFLDHSAGLDRFCNGAGDTLDTLAYGGEGARLIRDRDMELALDAAEAWLKRHARRRERT